HYPALLIVVIAVELPAVALAAKAQGVPAQGFRKIVAPDKGVVASATVIVGANAKGKPTTHDIGLPCTGKITHIGAGRGYIRQRDRFRWEKIKFESRIAKAKLIH